MKLTRKQRHKIYKLSLPRLKIGYDYEQFLCIVLRNTTNDLEEYNHIVAAEIPILFPEIREVRDKIKPNWGSGPWWDKDDKESRIKVLKECIQKTKPKSNEKRTVKPRLGKNPSSRKSVLGIRKRGTNTSVVGRKRTKKSS